MNWFYAEAGKQHGPVTAEEFDRLVAAGTITDTTLVWREGLPAWEPWSAHKPIGTPSAAPLAAPPMTPPAAASPLAPGEVRCSECGSIFPTEDTIPYGERRVCGACKPRFLQRLTEGAESPRQDGQTVTKEQLLARDYKVDIGSCFDRANVLLRANFGLLLGASIVTGLLIMAASSVPLLGIIAPLFLTGPLAGGLYRIFLARMRNRPAEFGLVFSGFSSNYWQLMLCQLMPSLLGFAIMIPLAMVFGPALIFLGQSNGSTNSAVIAGTLLVVAGVIGFVALIVGIYFYTAWTFALRLVADKNLQFWEALQLSRKVAAKHWWRVFWFSIVNSLIMMLGALLCFVGLLYTGPLYVAMSTCLYEDLFGDLAPQVR